MLRADGKSYGKEISLTAFNGKCFNCGEIGHKQDDCKKPRQEGKGKSGRSPRKGNHWQVQSVQSNQTQGPACWEKEENKSKRPKNWKSVLGQETSAAAVNTNTMIKLVLCSISVPKTIDLLKDLNIWIANAATTDSTPHAVGLSNTKTAGKEDAITMGNKMVEQASTVGDLLGIFCYQYGNKKMAAKLQDVTVLPKSGFNLFSITKRLKSGWKVTGNDKALILSKRGIKIKFDIAIHMPKGILFCTYFKRSSKVAAAATNKRVKTTIKQAHEKLGHGNEDMTRQAAKALGWTLTKGTLNPCEDCSISKAKQKNILKKRKDDFMQSNKSCIFLDIASVKKKEGKKEAPKLHWCIMMNECTRIKFSDFYAKKNDMVEPTCERRF